MFLNAKVVLVLPKIIYHSSIYDDIPRAFSNWQSNGVKLYIYSSGSVHAQKLLYGSSESGDLLPYIAGHFDTKVGMKQEAKSYENILNEIKCNGSDVVFFTDIPKGNCFWHNTNYLGYYT